VSDHEAIFCSCGAHERRLVRRARLAERDGRVAVVRDVPMEECTVCGELWLPDHLSERLDGHFIRLLDIAEVSVARWDDLRP
jgi:YgiT-type zinc finger domain-containing protein